LKEADSCALFSILSHFELQYFEFYEFVYCHPGQFDPDDKREHVPLNKKKKKKKKRFRFATIRTRMT